MSTVHRSLWEILTIARQPGQEVILDCDECFTLLDYLADMTIDYESVEVIRATVKNHLKHCPDCREHHLKKLREIEERWRRAPIRSKL
jgi:hypothetical protein